MVMNIQWSLQIKDMLGPATLSIVLFSEGFKCIIAMGIHTFGHCKVSFVRDCPLLGGSLHLEVQLYDLVTLQ